jgi:hypothetical protein
MTIEVQPGWREGTKITFTCEGDEAPETTTGKPDSWPLLISVFLGRSITL